MQAMRFSGFRRATAGPSRGFTLIELVTTIAVAAVLVAIALPSFSEFNRRAAVTDTTNALVGAINLARSEAVRRGQRVALIANGGSWSNGWTVKADGNGDNAYSDAADETLQSRPAVSNPSLYKVTAKATGTGATSDTIVFSNAGTLGLGTRYDVNVCRNGDAANSLHIVVNATGTVSSYRGTGNSSAPSC